MNSISALQSSDRTRNLRRNLRLLDRTRTIYLLRESFRIVPTLLATRPSSSIYSIALIIQSGSDTEVTVISSQETLISRFNTSPTHQHRSYPPHSRVFQYPTYPSSKSASVSCLGVRLNIKPSNRTPKATTSELPESINLTPILGPHPLPENQPRILCVRLTNQCYSPVQSVNSISRQKTNKTSSQETFEHPIND